jgi:hypothetical protein
MAANENTKFQINYKLSDGTLINLYAQDVKDLETGLNDLGMVAALIKATPTPWQESTSPDMTNKVAVFVTATFWSLRIKEHEHVGANHTRNRP